MPVSRKKLFIKEGGIIMFKAMPKAFWIGLVLIYGWMFICMVLEWTVPNFPLAYKILGIPGCWIYNMLIACYLMNILVAWYYAYSEEVREEKLAGKS
jgi:hypothetical protein